MSTGLRFFDHMLDQIARHGLIDLELICNGDLEGPKQMGPKRALYPDSSH
ncbi:hypothetical protein [Longimonas sp.]